MRAFSWSKDVKRKRVSALTAKQYQLIFILVSAYCFTDWHCFACQ